VKLLIADDEHTIREGLASAIDWKALVISRVMLASNGEKAYAMIAAEKPEIAILDIVMPEMTGIEIIARCRKDGNHPEFVIISAHDEFKYAQEALKYHVHNYVLKPCDTAEIESTVRGIISDLTRRRSIEEERKELQQRLDLLVPQARERLFADFVSGVPVGEIRANALRQSLEPAESFQLLLFYAGEERGALSALRQRPPAGCPGPPFYTGRQERSGGNSAADVRRDPDGKIRHPGDGKRPGEIRGFASPSQDRLSGGKAGIAHGAIRKGRDS
jgi:DNA-binding NarL/FixJ family response regulator